jgi:beta-lactamase superfamily II metal-dependent hydrolase
MSKTRVRIRMYRPGLGDCFLLTFRSGEQESHVLIDCGIFVGTADEKKRITEIAEHIRESAGNRVNALVATHEHWDHVSGFFHAKESFKKLEADEVWLAWTEDPEQTIAKENKKMLATMAKTVALAADRLSMAPSPIDRECGLAAATVLGFEGISTEMMGASKFSVRTDQAMDFVLRKKKDTHPFLKPGDVLERSWLPGVRVYVLGPPMNLASIKDMSGSEGEGFETKKHGAAMGWMSAVMLGSGQGEFDSAELEAAERLRPFDVSLAWPESDALHLSNDSHLGPLIGAYRDEPWRRVDQDWLHSAAGLALQVDNAVNNTSLVLAFELIESGDVLLFVGDAQIGNWNSWMNLEFTIGTGSARQKVTAADLLARTVFYKVGHHGSGNATLRKGLEAMTSTRLVAAIPTDETFAEEKQGWEMPAPKLKNALRAKTKGRILRADPGRDPIPKAKPRDISQAAWDRFRKAVSSQDLFVDYEC